MPYMKWPPQLKDLKVYGEVLDTSGRHYPRDIGRPVYLGGNTYYLFGDTFCHDKSRQFCGISNNTIAYVPDPKQDPIKCRYLHKEYHQPCFVPHSPSEDQYESSPENKRANNRVVNWCFGGIIEDAPGSNEGWVFFEKMLTHGAAAGKYFGMGVARVSVQPDKSLQVNRLMGDHLVFGPDEPHFGTTTHLSQIDGYVYLLGPKDPPAPTLDLKNFWTRIRRDADFTDRSNYEFLVHNLDGKGKSWHRHYTIPQLVNVIPAQAQGTVLYEPSLAPEGRPYMWFGVNKFGANRLYIACAPAIEGPWEEWEGPELPKYGGGGLRYCLYPHHRACNPGNGEMLISWSDDGKQMGGMVVLGMLNFVMEGEGAVSGGQDGTVRTHHEPQQIMGDGRMGELKGKAKSLLGSFMHAPNSRLR